MEKKGLSAELELLGSISKAVDEANRGILEERGRGVASNKEAWAELQERVTRAQKEGDKTKGLMKELWTSIMEQNDDAFAALMQELSRTAMMAAQNWALAAAMGKLAVEHTEG